MELRPVERRVTKLLNDGQHREVVAGRFLRTTGWVRLIERMVEYKQANHRS